MWTTRGITGPFWGYGVLAVGFGPTRSGLKGPHPCTRTSCAAHRSTTPARQHPRNGRRQRPIAATTVRHPILPGRPGADERASSNQGQENHPEQIAPRTPIPDGPGATIPGISTPIFRERSPAHKLRRAAIRAWGTPQPTDSASDRQPTPATSERAPVARQTTTGARANTI
jgi:hypothetical protein